MRYIKPKKKEKEILAVLTKGEFIGEELLSSSSRCYSYDVVAKSSCIVFSLERDKLMTQIHGIKDLKIFFNQRIELKKKLLTELKNKLETKHL